MAEHHAAITVHAPVEQVYPMWTHFNDFPTFMHFVKEVTYYDEQRSHWVADIVGRHEWDAMNDT
ncbi:MAG: SRPBCC family protein, partial [Ktedonobacterales bacterium]